MNRTNRAVYSVASLIGLSFALLCQSVAAMPPEERVKVKQLIAYVEGLQNVQFVRNGKRYPAAEAGQFMRLKCESKLNDLKRAQDAIAACFTRSDTSGEPYQMRFSDASLKPSAVVLTEALKQIEATAKR